MRRWVLVGVLMGVAAGAQGQTAGGTVLEQVAAPGGGTVYAITRRGDGKGNAALAIEAQTGGGSRVLLRAKPSKEPQQNLVEFSRLTLAPDGKTLFFQAAGWATSGAIHALEIASGKSRFVTAGGISCVVMAGKYRGDLVVEKHRYFVQGGSYDALYLVDPKGKEIGLVALSAKEEGVCKALEE